VAIFFQKKFLSLKFGDFSRKIKWEYCERIFLFYFVFPHFGEISHQEEKKLIGKKENIHSRKQV
jgi:hypothetical protein